MLKFGPLAFRMEKDEKEHLCVALAVFDMKIHSTLTPTKFKRGQGHLVNLSNGHLSVVSQHY